MRKGFYEIDKTFEFDYGHRVWTQELDSKFSIDNKCMCRFLHGHRGKIAIHLQRPDGGLEGSMVTDFKHLNWFKKFIDEKLDHKMILDINDPIRELVYQPKVAIAWNGNFNYGYFDPEGIRALKTEAERELYHGAVFVSFVPTSENLCKWFYAITARKMEEMGVEVSGVEFWETPKSHSVYYEVNT